MGIEVGIAVATVGVGTIVNKLASKGSKIMQTRHRPVMTKFDEIAARAKADKANSVPIDYENSATQFTAYQKGEMGKLRRMNEIEADGGTILTTEATFEINGTRVRPDIVYINREGLLILSEVKCGPYARPTTNQKKVLIPILKGGEHPVIYPKGKNAANIPGFQKLIINNKSYTGDYGVEYIHYDSPGLY